jgi:hypothetical protein
MKQRRIAIGLCGVRGLWRGAMTTEDEFASSLSSPAVSAHWSTRHTRKSHRVEGTRDTSHYPKIHGASEACSLVVIKVVIIDERNDIVVVDTRDSSRPFPAWPWRILLHHARVCWAGWTVASVAACQYCPRAPVVDLSSPVQGAQACNIFISHHLEPTKPLPLPLTPPDQDTTTHLK